MTDCARCGAATPPCQQYHASEGLVCEACHAREALADSVEFAAATDDGLWAMDEHRFFAFGGFGFFQIRIRGLGERLFLALGLISPRTVPTDRR